MGVVASILSLRTFGLGSRASRTVEAIHAFYRHQTPLRTVVRFRTIVGLFLSCIRVTGAEIDSCVLRTEKSSRTGEFS